MTTEPIEIALLPSLGTALLTDYAVVQRNAGGPLKKVTLAQIINTVGEGSTIVAGDVTITSGDAVLDTADIEVLNAGTLTFDGGSGTLSSLNAGTITGTTATLSAAFQATTVTATGALIGASATLSGTATAATLFGTVINGGTISITGPMSGASGTFSGGVSIGATITAAAGAIAAITGTTGVFSSSVSASALNATGAVNAATLAASSAVTGASVTASGAVNGGTVTSSGALAGATGSVSGLLTAGTISTAGAVTSATGTIGTVTGTTGVFSGTVSASAVAATGAVNAATLAASGAVTGASVTASGAVNGATIASSGAVTGASVVATTGTIGTITGTAGVFSGTVSASAVAATGAVNAATLASSGAVTGVSVTASGAVNAATLAASGAVTGASGAITNLLTAGTITVGGTSSAATHTATIGAYTTAAIETLIAGGTISPVGAIDQRYGLLGDAHVFDGSGQLVGYRAADGGLAATEFRGDIARVGAISAEDETITFTGTLDVVGDGSAISFSGAKIEKLDARLGLLGDDVAVDSAGAVLSFRDNDVWALGPIEITSLSGTNDTIAASGVLEFATGGVTIGGADIVDADARYALLGDMIVQDSAGAVIGVWESDGNLLVGQMEVESLHVGDPVGDSAAVPKSYVDAVSGSLYLEPNRDYAAVGDGVTDDSAAVNDCITAALARGDRMMDVERDYYVPTLDKLVCDLICIGAGSFIGAPVVKYVVSRTAPPPPPIPMTFRARVHCPIGAAAAAGGTVRVVITGDSVSRWGISEYDEISGPAASIVEALLRENPGVNFEIFNRGVGGGDWNQLGGVANGGYLVPWYTDVERDWLEYIEDLEPHIVFVSCSRNGSAAFNWDHIKAVQTVMAGWTQSCDLVVCNSVGEMQTSDDSGWINLKNADDYAANSIANYCLSHGIGLIDTHSADAWARFGFAERFAAQLVDTDVFGAGTGSQALTLPWTANEDVYGFSVSIRTKVGGWTDMGNEFSVKLGEGRTNNMDGCAVIFKRDPITFEISYLVRITDTAAGASATWTFIAETSLGVNCDDSSLQNITVAVQGARLYIRTTGDIEATPPVNRLIPRPGGPFTPEITCPEGAVSGAIEFTGVVDGPRSCAAVRPRKEVLCMPVLTDREFGDPNGVYTDWGGGGPHPGSRTRVPIFDAAFFPQDFCLI